MKRHIALLALLLAVGNAFSQSDSVFNRVKYYYGTPADTWNTILSVANSDDRTFISLGLANQSSVGQRFAIVEIDESGNALNKYFFGDSAWMFSYTYPRTSLIVDGGGNLLAVNNYFVSPGFPIRGSIVKLNQDLDTIWTRHYDLPVVLAGCTSDSIVRNELTAIRQTLDKGYIMAGNYDFKCISGNQRGFLVKIDSLGFVEWWKPFTGLQNFYDIKTTSDSGFVIISVPIHRGLNFVKLDKMGDVEWNKDIDPYFSHRVSYDVQFANDTIAYIASPYVYDPSYPIDKTGIGVYKLNLKSQQLIWDRKYRLYETFDGSYDVQQCLRVEILKDNSIIICGTVMMEIDSTYGTKGIMLKLNSEGDSLWARFYINGDSSDRTQFNDILQREDDGFLAVGFHFSNTGLYNAGAWLVRMDSNGYAPGPDFDTGTP